jgi:hypothetical protein
VVVSKLGVAYRAAFVLAFFGLQAFGIYFGQREPDHAFGFQMFNESSRVTVRLFREVARKKRRELLPVPDGHWQAPDARGNVRDYAWETRARAASLWVLGRSVHARYGLDAQLFRLQAALEDAVRHIPEDTQTLALVAEVETSKNGKPGPLVRLRADRP